MIEARPAQQAGLCRLGIVLHDRSAILEFRYLPARRFEFWFFGSAKIFAELSQELGLTNPSGELGIAPNP